MRRSVGRKLKSSNEKQTELKKELNKIVEYCAEFSEKVKQAVVEFGIENIRYEITLSEFKIIRLTFEKDPRFDYKTEKDFFYAIRTHEVIPQKMIRGQVICPVTFWGVYTNITN